MQVKEKRVNHFQNEKYLCLFFISFLVFVSFYNAFYMVIKWNYFVVILQLSATRKLRILLSMKYLGFKIHKLYVWVHFLCIWFMIQFSRSRPNRLRPTNGSSFQNVFRFLGTLASIFPNPPNWWQYHFCLKLNLIKNKIIRSDMSWHNSLNWFTIFGTNQNVQFDQYDANMFRNQPRPFDRQVNQSSQQL